MKQKEVDIKIGLDVAWVSFNHLARNIILIAGDYDFTPVIKTARRTGVFVYLLTKLNNTYKYTVSFTGLMIFPSILHTQRAMELEAVVTTGRRRLWKCI
ncbi:NYN domain-containing protein [Breznakiellaceae bacterium SP9]